MPIFTGYIDGHETVTLNTDKEELKDILGYLENSDQYLTLEGQLKLNGLKTSLAEIIVRIEEIELKASKDTISGLDRERADIKEELENRRLERLEHLINNGRINEL